MRHEKTQKLVAILQHVLHLSLKALVLMFDSWSSQDFTSEMC